jgi:hypothetical protein
LPSATVTITPNPFGLMDCTSFLSLSFLFDLLFFEIETRSEKGTKTINPARESSALILGPLVDIGSFTTCTKID